MKKSGGGCGKTLMFGGLGCLGLIVVSVTIIAVVSGVAMNRAQDLEVERRELTRTLEIPEAIVGLEESAIQLDPASMPPAGKVVLDINQAEFHVKPGPPGEPLRVEAKFDVESYELTERFTEAIEESGWVYKIVFRRTSSSSFMAALTRLFSGAKPRIVVYLPPDVPFDFDLSVSQGGGEMELGGLWLTNIDMDFMQGGGEVSFSDPLRYPAESIRIEFSMGGGEFNKLGNASPRRLDIEIGMGGGDIDLRGEWTRDAKITIDQSMGGASVRLPRNVEIRGLDRPSLETPSDDEVPRPVLTFEVSSRMGGLDIVD